MNNFTTYCAFAILIAGLIGCASEPPPNEETLTPTDAATPVEDAISRKLAPPAGQALLIVGQDYDTVTNYTQAIPEPLPAGFTSYTSLKLLEGLTEPTDYGAGVVHLNGLVNDYPDSVLALGLHLVDYLDVIVEGNANKKIDELLEVLAATDRPVYLRFGYEFDGSWNHYDPEAYKQAWIVFKERVDAHPNADNIVMVWQSATYCDGTYRAQPIEAWYPGDAYVDWVGLSFFTQSTCNYQPLEELVDFAREHNKPVMIAEAAPQRYKTGDLNYSVFGRQFEERTADEIWNEWYAPFFKFIEDNRDVVRAVAYINAHWDEQPMWGSPYRNGYWGDSRVQASSIIQERWTVEITSPTWLHSSPTLFEELN